jgi:integrase/recombinase XerD
MTAKKESISREFNELYEYVELSEGSEFEVRLREYSRWMLSQNYSTKTVSNNTHILSKFVVWCHERGILRPQEMTREILEHYQGKIIRYRKPGGEAYNVSYLIRILSALRGFFGWLAKKRYILYNPALELELPRLDKHLPRNIMSMAEVEAVMMQVDLSSPLGLRDRAMLEVLYSTGMRRFELRQLKYKDLFMDTGVVMIREGKGRKDRMVPIGERALAWVEKYRVDLRPRLVGKHGNGNDEGILFLSYRGKPLSLNNINRIVTTYIRNSGIEKEGSCHMFRHTIATLMLENGADIRYIQQILGHNSLESTQIYTHVSIKKLKEVHEKTHPGANLRKGENPAKS